MQSFMLSLFYSSLGEECIRRESDDYPSACKYFKYFYLIMFQFPSMQSRRLLSVK